MRTLSFLTCTAEETFLVGEKLGRLLDTGDFIGLTGDLGAGKTHFTKGLAAGLDVSPSVTVTSPTYTLMNSYIGRLPLHHFDLYRLRGDDDVAELGFAEYFYGEAVSVVEWADRMREELPEERLTVEFIHEGSDNRRLQFFADGERYEILIDALSAELLPSGT